MFFVFGSRLMGKVDEVPGLFHVATRFGHLNYLPLIPMQTYIVLSQTGNGFRGVAIPMSGRSIAYAWGRALSLLGCVIGGFMAIAFAGMHDSLWPAIAIFTAACGGIFYLLTWHKPMRRASFTRANELAAALGANARTYEKIREIYGESAGRGFEVVPAGRAGPAVTSNEDSPASD